VKSGMRSILLLPLMGLVLSSAACAQDATDHEAKAQEYLRTRQPELARKEFEALVAADPKNLNAQTNLGVLDYFAGDYKDAEVHLRIAVQADPGLARQQALLGFSERRNGELEAARKDLGAALPGLQEPRLKKQAGLELVELDSAAGDLPSAAVAISQLKASNPTDPEILYVAYRIYTDLSGEAMLDLSLAAPESPQMHQAMAHELARERDNKGAIANLRSALAADPHLPGAHFELAALLHASSDAALKAEAEEQYRLALQDNPHDEKALTRVGDLLADKGEHEKAIASYRQALSLQPESPEAAIGLAHELVETGHPDQALPLLQAVIRNDPGNLLAHYRLSGLYRRLRQPEAAKREVAEYEKLKAMREKLRTIYEALRMDSPRAADVNP
jgi:tetratricopeptide (TPR) repeat protein